MYIYIYVRVYDSYHVVAGKKGNFYPNDCKTDITFIGQQTIIAQR